MEYKITVTVKGSDKSLTQKFKTDDIDSLSPEGEFLKGCISKVVSEFATNPEKIKVKCTYDI